MDDGKFGSEWIRSFLQLNAIPGGVIQWPYVVGPGGGGIRIGQYGITSVTDAGAAGRIPLTYDPTNDRIGIGIAAPAFALDLSAGAASDIRFIGQNRSLNWAGDTGLFPSVAAPLGVQSAPWGPMLSASWLLTKGVVVMDDDFTGTSWAVGNLGPKWRGTIGAGGAIALLNAARGGIIDLFSAAVMAPTFLDQGNNVMIYRDDGWRYYSRWRSMEAVNANKFMGVANAAMNRVVGIRMDTAGGGALATNFCFESQSAAGVTDNDTGNAYNTDMAVWESIPTGTSIACYRNGVLVATNTNLQWPANGEGMECHCRTVCLGASVDARLHIDVVKVVESRNTGVGDV